MGRKIAPVRRPRVGALNPALIQHPLNLTLGNQNPIPEPHMAESPIMEPEVHPRP
jgi:hypothetical protein